MQNNSYSGNILKTFPGSLWMLKRQTNRFLMFTFFEVVIYIVFKFGDTCDVVNYIVSIA